MQSLPAYETRVNVTAKGTLIKNRASHYVATLIVIPAVWIAAAFSFSGALAPGPPSDGVARRLECGSRLKDLPDGGTPLAESARIVLVTDEEWREVVSGRHPSEARRVLLEAASLFRGVSIHLLSVRVVDWVSPDDAQTIRDVWAAARETVPLGDADIVVVLSAQERTTTQDGYAKVGGRYVGVAAHLEEREQDALVLAHEISHLFGAHHGCDVPGREGLMAPKGFDQDLICPCTRRVLELNANRFHEVIP